MVVQGRELIAEDAGQMQGLLAEHPDRGRTRLSEELCRRWDCHLRRGAEALDAIGILPDFAGRARHGFRRP